MSLVDLAAVDVAVVVTANVLGALMSFPQAWRLWRTGEGRGVSAQWAGVSLAANLWWAAYAVGRQRWALAPVAVVSVVGYALVLAGLRRGRGADRDWLGAAATIAIVPVVPLAMGGWTVAGVVLGCLYGVQLAPAVLATGRDGAVEGVSVGTWTLAALEAVLWVWYGARVGDAGLVALGGVGTVLSGVVLARVRRRRRVADLAGAVA